MKKYLLIIFQFLGYIFFSLIIGLFLLVIFYWLFIPDMDPCSFHEEEPSWLVRLFFDFDSGFHPFPNWMLFSFSMGLGVLITYLIFRKRNPEI
jgi:hypothetical protein